MVRGRYLPSSVQTSSTAPSQSSRNGQQHRHAKPAVRKTGASTMEEQPIAYQQLLKLNAEADALDTEIKAAVGEMKAAVTDGDRAMYREVYNNLVADKRELSTMRAALTAQLAGGSHQAGGCHQAGGSHQAVATLTAIDTQDAEERLEQ